MSKLPPGPKIAPLNSLGYLRNPYAFYETLRAKYGDPITIPTMYGVLVVTGDPAGVKEIFSARPETFGVFGTNALAPVLGETSLIQVSGTAHTSRRKLMMPAFHGERMHAYGGQFRSIARRHGSRLESGKTFQMQDLAKAITLEAIIQAVFGITEAGRVSRWTETLEGLMDAGSPAGLIFPFMRNDVLTLGGWSRFQNALQAVHALMDEEIAGRKATGARGDDILSLLIDARFDDGQGMADEELRNQLMTLLVAGHETTSTAIAWAFYWLDAHPEVRQSLVDELAPLGEDPEPMALMRLPYLDAFCQETLRLNPIVPDVARHLKQPFTLKGYEIPAGLNVGVATSLLHLNPEVYADPKRFRPERFLERSYSPFEFAPFGGGARRCIGSAFATFQMKVVITTLLQDLDLKRTSDTDVVAVRRNITMGPKGGVEMKLVGSR